MSLNTEGRLSTATAAVSAALAASCCLLPILLIATGLASAGLMVTMMRYEWLTLPAGVLGLGGAYVAYFSRRRQCASSGCRFVGEHTARAVLGIATTVVLVAILLRLFPSWTAAILQHQHV